LFQWYELIRDSVDDLANVLIAIDLEESIRTLFSYSLAKRSGSDDSFSIHPLVHSWAKLRLESDPQKELEVAREAFELLGSGVYIFDENRMRTVDWIFEQRVMPHIDAATKHMSKDVDVQNGSKSLGDVYRRHGQHNKALGWYEQALAGSEKTLGVDHPDTLLTVHCMALAFYNQGQYDKALEWYGRALAGYEKSLGVDHPSTLATVRNMALVFNNQGQYDKALEWYRRALARTETTLGADHPEILTTVHNMALAFYNQGQYDKALEWYGRALAGREKGLGADHPETITTVHSMAAVFYNQGQYTTALEWFGRALAGGEKALGVNHPYTQDTIGWLIALHEETGQTEQANNLRARLNMPNGPSNQSGYFEGLIIPR